MVWTKSVTRYERTVALLLSCLVLVVVLSGCQRIDRSRGSLSPGKVTWHHGPNIPTQVSRAYGLTITDGRGNCVIWTQTPRGPADMERFSHLYHELLHCQYGEYHGRTP